MDDIAPRFIRTRSYPVKVAPHVPREVAYCVLAATFLVFPIRDRTCFSCGLMAANVKCMYKRIYVVDLLVCLLSTWRDCIEYGKIGG